MQDKSEPRAAGIGVHHGSRQNRQPDGSPAAAARCRWPSPPLLCGSGIGMKPSVPPGGATTTRVRPWNSWGDVIPHPVVPRRTEWGDPVAVGGVDGFRPRLVVGAIPGAEGRSPRATYPGWPLREATSSRTCSGSGWPSPGLSVQHALTLSAGLPQVGAFRRRTV